MLDHNDVYSGIDSNMGQDQPVDETYEQFNESATDDVEISHPETDREKILRELPLLVRMANENREEFDEESLENQTVDELFDEKICQFAVQAMQDAGLSVDRYKTHQLRALLLKQVREIPSYKELADYLDTYNEERLADFGLGRKYSQSLYRKRAKKLKRAGEHELLKEAAFIAVHAAWWTGHPLPDDVGMPSGIDSDVDPKGSNFGSSRDLAFYSLLSDLLDIVYEHLTLNRASNASKDIESVMGAFATAAYSGKSVEEYHKAARHTFDLSDALAGSTIRKHIRKQPSSDVESMFESIHFDLFEYVIDSGVVQEPLTASYDLVDLDSFVGEGSENGYRTKDGRIEFACLALTDPDLEFSFGLKPLISKSERTDQLEELLLELNSRVDIDRLFVDRGFNGGEDIKVMEEHLPQRWGLHAKDDRDIRGIGSDVEKVESVIEPGKNAVIRSSAFKDVATPLWMYVYNRTDDDADSDKANDSTGKDITDTLNQFTELNRSSTPLVSLDQYRLFYLTVNPFNIKRSENCDIQSFIDKINFKYNKRSKIENAFRQSKNGLCVSTESSHDLSEVFYFNMSFIFYNLYKIMNTVPAPYGGLELDVNENELLKGVQVLSFGGTGPLEAYRHLDDTS